jgi:hypothetical protein
MSLLAHVKAFQPMAQQMLAGFVKPFAVEMFLAAYRTWLSHIAGNADNYFAGMEPIV